jgi:hypothetical protein
MAKTAHLDPAAPATIKSWRTGAMKLSRIELSARLVLRGLMPASSE